MTIRSLTRPFRHWFTARALKAMRWSLRVLPKPWIRGLGSTMGRLVGALLRRDCRAIEGRLKQSECAHISVGQIWSDLGRRLFEFLAIEKFLDDVDIDESAHEAFKTAGASGTGILVATGHLGHWELMAAALSSRGYSVQSIAGRPSPGPVNQALEKIRQNLGVKTIHRGGGARRAVQLLNRHQTVAVFCDQNTGERSRNVLFLGRPAPTPLTFERLQRVTQSSPLFVWNLFDGAGRYTVYAENIPPDSDLTGWIQHRLERIVKENPTQWVWLHDRWHMSRRNPRTPVRSELLSESCVFISSLY